MKFRFLALLALVLGLASCQKDTYGLDVDANGEAAVTISVALPDVETRAGGKDSAIGAFGNVDFSKDYDVRYILEVYNLADGSLAKERLVNYENEAMETSFTLRLIPGRGYRFVVWADLVKEGTKTDLHYNTANLKDIQLATTEWGLSDETRDAYTGICDEGTFSSASNITIELKRPLGKLRVVTTDIKDMFNVLPEDIEVVYSSQIYTSFDAHASNVKGKETITHVKEIKISDSKYKNEWAVVDGVDKVKENLTLFTDYYFAANEQEPISFTLDVVDNKGMAIPQVVFSTPIPIQRNYLTTVMGPVLTDANSITVVVKDAFENGTNWNPEEDEYDVDAEGNLHVASVEAIWDAVKVENATIYVYPNPNTADGSYDIEGKLSLAKGVRLIGVGNEPVKLTNSWSSNLFAYQAHFTDTYMENICADNNLVIDAGIANGNVVFKKCIFGGNLAHQGVHFDSGNGTITFDECTFIGRNMLGSSIEKVTFNKCYFENKRSSLTGADKWTGVNMWGKYEFNECTFDTDAHCNVKCDGVVAAFNSCSFVDARDITSVVNNKSEFDATITFDGVQTVYDAKTLAALLTADNKDIVVALGADIEVPITSLGNQTSGSGEYKLGGESTEYITIDLGGKKLNITTTYWSAIGAKNNDALFTIKNGTMTSTGNSAGTWNAWDVRLSNCNYAIEDVTFEKAVALDNVGKSTSMKNVTITDNHDTDTYGLWITAEGQTVTLDGCVIDMTPATDGRGIKIDNQYVAAGSEKKVTLNVANTTFKTDEKAAIVVKNPAGADINLKNINIVAVADDSDFAVWVDKNAAAYADLVTVTGGLKKVEGSSDAVVGTQEDFADAVEEGATIYLSDGTYNMPSTGGKDITIVGDKDVIINAGAANMGSGNVTLEGVTITAGLYKGFQHSGVVTYDNVTIQGQLNCYGKEDIFNNCTFELNNAYVWTYGSKKTVFNKCTFNTTGKAILIYNEGAGACNVEVTNCTFNATAGAKAGAIANQNCAAIEIDNYAKMAHKLTTSGNTVDDKFSGEWRIKSYVEGAPVTVNGVEYTYIAVDGKKMTIDGDKNVTVVE